MPISYSDNTSSITGMNEKTELMSMSENHGQCRGRRPALGGGSRVGGLLALLVLVTALLISASVSMGVERADAALQIDSIGGSAVGPDGRPLTQAGAHPDVTTTFETNVDENDLYGGPAENFKDVFTDLPPGLIIDPSATPTCTQTVLAQNSGPCPAASQVGVITIRWGRNLDLLRLPLYNMVPPVGVPGRLGANFANVLVLIDATVRSGGDYGISAVIRDSSQSQPAQLASVTLWGVPADASHDARRGNAGVGVDATRRPFVSNPSNCSAGLLSTTIRMNSWAQPNVFVAASFDHDFDGNPLQVTGCENVSFDPSLTARPQSHAADTPTGLDVALTIPQNTDPDGLATALLDRATVNLPEGMVVNPSSADGLAGCSPAQIGLDNADDPSCPDASKIGTTTIDTPLLTEPLEGGIYLAKQNENPFGSTLALYLVAKGSGVVIKLPGKIIPDPVTGRLKTVFDDNPQLPFRSLKLHFKGGSRAPLVNPPTCGTKTTTAEFVPWSAADKDHPTSSELKTSSDAFEITSGPNGTPCAATLADRPFAPTVAAGLTNPAAGSSSAFVVDLVRPAGNQELGGLDVTLAPGVLGNIGSVPLCPEAQAAAGTCDAGSRVGSTTVGVGAGSAPVSIPQAGKSPTAVYLAGPYKGAPYSLSIVVPAQAGPFDLGNVVVRAAIFVDPIDAHVTVRSDELPTILQGIPLAMQSINVTLDRVGFMVSPTNCNPMRIDALVRSTQGKTANPSSNLQMSNCSALALKPELALSLSGKGQTTDGKHPAVSARLTQKAGQANLKKVKVTLPLSLALDPDNANGLCEFVDGTKAEPTCPKNSIVGTATATTPILNEPLTGPVYFVKNIRKDAKTGREIRTLPKLVIPLVGQNGVKLTLTGTSDVVDDQLVTTFDNVPDAPVSSFKLDIIGGKGGILTVSGADICKATQIADQQINGQNNKTATTDVYIQTPACPLKVLSKKVGKRSVTLKVGGLSAGKVTVTGRGIKKTTKTITKSTVATITAKRTKGKPGKVTVSFDPAGPAKAHKTTK
jgi:uncharacterized ParB-like nuclease family protein